MGDPLVELGAIRRALFAATSRMDEIEQLLEKKAYADAEAMVFPLYVSLMETLVEPSPLDRRAVIREASARGSTTPFIDVQKVEGIIRRTTASILPLAMEGAAQLAYILGVIALERDNRDLGLQWLNGALMLDENCEEAIEELRKIHAEFIHPSKPQPGPP